MIVIGIVGRTAKVNDETIVLVYKTLCDKLFSYDVFPICLVPSIKNDNSFNYKDVNRLKKMISICDGVILQGGKNYTDYDLEIVRYLYQKDIPTLGICLGMQMMGEAINGKVSKDANHNLNEDYAHPIIVEKNSKLYEIIGKDHTYVNSLHNDRVCKTNLDISAFCGDVIEAIEDKKKNFFMGVQWHPELLDDDNTDKLFKEFILSCKRK